MRGTKVWEEPITSFGFKNHNYYALELEEQVSLSLNDFLLWSEQLAHQYTNEGDKKLWSINPKKKYKYLLNISVLN